MRLEYKSRVQLLIALVVLTVLATAGASAQAVVAGDPVDGAPWVRYAVPAVLGGAPPLDNVRPGALIATSRYDYGPQSPNGNNIETYISVEPNNYNQAVTLYVEWWNRVTNQVMYYNLQSGFTSQEVDLFGNPGEPAKIVAPDLTDFCLFGTGCALGPVPASIPTVTGQYAFVIEVRNAAGTNLLARAYALYVFADAVVPVGGTISDSQTWTSNNVYLVDQRVNVGNGGTLTIQPGTIVLGGDVLLGGVIVQQGGTLIADGTSTMPIIFTSRHDYFDRGLGDWFGLVVNGNGPTNQQNPLGEGNSGPYGGNDPNDSSGILRYVRVEFAGIRFNEEDEANAIAFQGIGNGTIVSHVQTLSGADDGIESFGGIWHGDNIFIRNADDDSLDATFGAQVTVNNLCIIQTDGTEIDTLFEFDNDADAPNASPRTLISVDTFTGINLRTDRRGALIRRGATVHFSNGRVWMHPGSAKEAFAIDGQDSQDQLTGGGTTFSNVVVENGNPVSAYTGVNEAPVNIPGLTAGVAGVVDPTSHVDPIPGSNGCQMLSEPWVNLGER